ncbi:MAG: phosphoribosylformylglycinamidine synthase subunit PurL [Bdellovibrionales bacterium]|nr:phosphoribosylformylglycinamidine synthase subunit PurL [Bdellovibrionales bacterium]
METPHRANTASKENVAASEWWRREASLDDAIQHGLKDSEFKGILNALGRSINLVEVGICAALYSEHCSYKSTKAHLRNLPTDGKNVIQGPGENAGIVRIAPGLGVAFKVESHNHPSFIEPFQGAATGVGGILRDVFTMGARPLAVLDSLRFGPPTDRYSRYLLKNVVRGIGTYGNCMGIPNIGGETFFHERYTKNCLVNAFAMGIVEEDKIFLGNASGVGNPVFYVGSKTGRDGIHGATMASEEFDESSAEKRPTVQVGDPLQEKLLLEACLEVMKTGHVVGIQDMGAAGMTSSSFEMAERAGSGVRLDLEKVPMREVGMNPYEIMLSESQERMLLVVEKGAEEPVCEIFARWNLDAVQIGEVTAEKDVELFWYGECVSALPASVLTSSVPMYQWPEREPSNYRDKIAFDVQSLEQPEDLSRCLYDMISSPNLCPKQALFEQYDSTVRGNTAVGPGGDSGVIRVKVEEKSYDVGISATLDCNSRYCELDPYLGAAHSVVEAYRNITATGCEAIGISDCLNFGSPEKPEGMWQIAQGIRGLGDAARALGVPIVSGNVSLYNETQGSPILPTPTIAMVGKIDNYRLAVGASFKNAGDTVLYLGDDFSLALGGSEYLAQIFEVEKGALPDIDYRREIEVAKLLRQLIEDGLVVSSHDVGTGGVAVALVESCFRPSCFSSGTDPFGVSLSLSQSQKRTDIQLFGEGGPRYLVSVKDEHVEEVEKRLKTSDIRILGKGQVLSDATLSIARVSDGSKSADEVLSVSVARAFQESVQTMRKLFS